MLLLRKSKDEGWHAPPVTTFSDESALQTLLKQSPHLLPGGDDVPMAVASEVAVPGIGYVDLVGVDASGNIALVECKLKANPEIRRSVVGQIFAYAAGVWKLSYEEFDQTFKVSAGAPLAECVRQSLPEEKATDWNEEEFRSTVASNLAGGVFRLVIAVDQITDELKRIVLFLNEHAVPSVQVLALELGYIADEGVEILLPSVYGEESVRAKASSAKAISDEASVFTTLSEYCSAEGVQAVRELYEFAKQRGSGFYWGRGSYPTVTARFLVGGRVVSVWCCYAYPSNPAVEIGFRYMVPYVSDESLARLADRLRQIPQVSARLAGLEQAGYNKGPSLSIDQILAQRGAVETINAAIDELMKSGFPKTASG